MTIPQPTAGYPRNVYNAAGERVEVILDVATYEALLEALEDAEDVALANAAMDDPDCDPLPLDEAFADIKQLAADRERRAV